MTAPTALTTTNAPAPADERDAVSAVIKLAIELDPTLDFAVRKKLDERVDRARSRAVREVMKAHGLWPAGGDPDYTSVVLALTMIKALHDVAAVQFDTDDEASADPYRPESTRRSYVAKFHHQQTAITRSIRERLEELVRIRDLIRGGS